MSDLRSRIGAAIPDGLDAVMAVVDDALDTARHNSRGRCRYCRREAPKPGPDHDMRCQRYRGPLTHTWVRSWHNESFGGWQHLCSCGATVRVGGIAGMDELADCPRIGMVER